MNFSMSECTYDVDQCYTDLEITPVTVESTVLCVSLAESQDSTVLNKISIRLWPNQQEHLFEYLKKALNKC